MPEAPGGEVLNDLVYQRLTPGDPEQGSLVREAYGLLASAHYRTAPSDLQMMMENPDLELVVARSGDQLVGALLLNAEGGLDDRLTEAVFLGERRPKGHLLAQMITAQTGARQFARFRGLRVQRIAVVGTWRRRGVGSGLLAQADQLAEEAGVDYLGASFALDTGSTGFWQRNGYIAVSLSHAQGKSSGSHSLAVISPRSDRIANDINDLAQKLARQLPMMLLLSLQTMEAAHVVSLLRAVGYRSQPDDLELNDLEAFIRGERGLESCFVSVQAQVMQAIAQSTGEVEDLVVYKAVLNRPWSVLPRQHGSEGKRQLQRRLRALVEALLKA